MRSVYPNELYHYGILGMKWGVRRYQNPDGSLTEAGKKRLSKSYEDYDKARNRAIKFDEKSTKKLQSYAKQNRKREKWAKKLEKNPDDIDAYKKMRKYDKQYTKSLSKHAKYEKKRFKYEKLMNKNLKLIKSISELDPDTSKVISENSGVLISDIIR